MKIGNVQGFDSLRIEPRAPRQTIQEVVYQRLSYALMAGRFDPGQTLTISYLADLFGTSHMPVREALRRLAAEKALQTTPSGSSIVPFVNRAMLDDLCDARCVVEGHAAARAIDKIDPPLLRTLEHNLADHAAAGAEEQIETMLQKNQEFHFLIYGASGSETMLQLIEALWLRFGPYLRMLSKHLKTHGGNKAEYTEHHRDMILAIRARDADALRAHIVADIDATRELLRTLCPAD
ncbi:GntR family transcriptional regulator [Mesorhizobium sp. CAU 1732]|uniref:GntR family transcriptional regulator n=1 Tax=Mesorhizobium sp. CAU 1732 TaxID=3140358 RepID=UPI003260CDBA